jgi:hypothetical protein
VSGGGPHGAGVRGGLRVTAAALCAFCVTAPGKAEADEPIAASEPRMLSETAEITSVVDAFDKDDPFDLHLTLGFLQSWKHASIRRETSLNQPQLSSGNFVASTENVASYSESTSTLNIGADIGIYRDLALIFRLPFIVSNSQSLDDLNGSSSPQNAGRLQDSNGQQLFSVPFKSPTRSGIDYLSVGLDWAIFNQQRDSTKPTWVIGVEGRFGIGTPLHACNDNGVTVSDGTTRKCPDPVNPLAPDRDPGISRAMNSVGAHTIFSRRYGYIEPYSGLWFLADFPQSGSDFAATNNLQGSLVNHPPLLGTFAMGVEAIPWEHREQFQRLVADLRVLGTYHSPGREYSELFDALGSSQAATLRNPNPGAYHANPNPAGPPSVADPSAQQVFFTGITDQQAYGSLGGRLALTWQAGEYIKFNVGAGLTYNQSHLISSADSCNPDFKGDLNASGPCHTVASGGSGFGVNSTGIPNPNHRDVIDLPGHRFVSDDGTIVDLWVNGVVMF